MVRVMGGQIKVVGKSGQIALGKSFVGKALRVEHAPNGAIILTPVAVVPESQLWTTEEAASTEPAETPVEALLKRRPKGVAKARGLKQ